MCGIASFFCIWNDRIQVFEPNVDSQWTCNILNLQDFEILLFQSHRIHWWWYIYLHLCLTFLLNACKQNIPFVRSSHGSFGNKAPNIFVLSAKSALGFCFFVDSFSFLCMINCIDLTWQLHKQVSGYCIWCLIYCRLIVLLKQMTSSTLHSARLEITTSGGLWLWGNHPMRHTCLYFRTRWTPIISAWVWQICLVSFYNHPNQAEL